jgi:glycerol uptake facilitator-like aquaporin
MLCARRISLLRWIVYIIAQVAGASCAALRSPSLMHSVRARQLQLVCRAAAAQGCGPCLVWP